MKTLSFRRVLCALLLLVVFVVPAPTQADAEKEVIAAARAIIEAANAGDFAALNKLEKFHSRFGAGGGLLDMPRDRDETSSTEEADSDQHGDNQREVTWHFSHWKHPEVYVSGNMAFMTGYLHLTQKVEGGSKTFNWRDTNIFEKQNGNWVRIHHHTSPFNIKAEQAE